MYNVLNCDIVVSEFEIYLSYYVNFWINTLRNGVNSIVIASCGLNSTTTVLPEWHDGKTN